MNHFPQEAVVHRALILIPYPLSILILAINERMCMLYEFEILVCIKRRGSKPFFVVMLMALGVASGPAVFAQGGPPMLTDDPGTLGYRRWEINTAVKLEKSISGKEFEAPLLDINYGLGKRIQLKLEVPYRLIYENGENKKTGTGS